MKTLSCGICKREHKPKFKVPSSVTGLVQLIDHWKAEHPGRVTTSNGTPVENMPMGWAQR